LDAGGTKKNNSLTNPVILSQAKTEINAPLDRFCFPFRFNHEIGQKMKINWAKALYKDIQIPSIYASFMPEFTPEVQIFTCFRTATFALSAHVQTPEINGAHRPAVDSFGQVSCPLRGISP
jgi:hypothetical protein